MKRINKKSLYSALIVLAAFLLWTIALRVVNVEAIGPEGSTVGFATLNSFVKELTGVHMALYTITDYLSIIPLGFVAAFALLGLAQWIKRKKLSRVDHSILILGAFYFFVFALFILFEMLAINYRPVLINGVLEASYPSSTSMLVICVMSTAAMQLNERLSEAAYRRCATCAIIFFTAFMVLGRLISGVHWFTDIVGGVLLSTGIVLLYYSVSKL